MYQVSSPSLLFLPPLPPSSSYHYKRAFLLLLLLLLPQRQEKEKREKSCREFCVPAQSSVQRYEKPPATPIPAFIPFSSSPSPKRKTTSTGQKQRRKRKKRRRKSRLRFKLFVLTKASHPPPSLHAKIAEEDFQHFMKPRTQNG